MIKTFIKHKITEIAIDTLFSKLQTNFPPEIELYVGQRFTSISTLELFDYYDEPDFYEFIKYGRCTIESITDSEIGFYYYDIVESYNIDAHTNMKTYNVPMAFTEPGHIYELKRCIIETTT